MKTRRTARRLTLSLVLVMAVSVPVLAERVYFACDYECVLRVVDGDEALTVVRGCHKLAFAQPVEGSVAIDRDLIASCPMATWTGVVEIQAGANGAVLAAHVLKPIPCIDDEFLEQLLSALRFRPATVDGVPTNSIENVAVRFDPKRALIEVLGNHCPRSREAADSSHDHHQ